MVLPGTVRHYEIGILLRDEQPVMVVLRPLLGLLRPPERALRSYAEAGAESVAPLPAGATGARLGGVAGVLVAHCGRLSECFLAPGVPSVGALFEFYALTGLIAW